jgi:hypothetical protein
MEILPRPVGVLASAVTASTSTASVATTGTVSGFSGLTVGSMYYATTSGALVTDGQLYGRSPGTTAVNADTYAYVDDITDEIIVTLDAQVIHELLHIIPYDLRAHFKGRLSISV